MKKLISLILFLATSLPVVASAATVEQLMGLGLPPALATELATESQFSFAGDAVLKLDADANRLLTFGASSDTALSLLFGDATDSQTFTIGSASANTDDNDTLALAGGSAVADGRGGSIELFGSDVASTGGAVRITGDAGGASGNVIMAAWSGGVQNTNWTFVYDGRISQDATNGGDIIFAKAGSQIKYPAAVVITPSTAFPTPNAGDTISNRYNIIAAGAPTATFVELPVATISVGRTHTVMNSSSNPVAIVPQGGDTQGVAAAATPYSCATLKKCNCTAFTTSNWQCDAS